LWLLVEVAVAEMVVVAAGLEDLGLERLLQFLPVKLFQLP
jgi:hypothetical protein